MNYGEKNREFLQQYRPLLLDRMTKWEEKDKEPACPCDNVYSTEAKDGSSVLHVVRDGKDHRLNSPYRPIAEAERWTEQYNFKNLRTNVVLFGMGNFLFAQALLKQLQDDGALAIYEPSFSVWQWAMDSVDLTDVIKDERVYLIIEDLNKDDLVAFLDQTCHWTSVGSQITCHHTGYDTLFAESYRGVLETIQRHMNLAVINRDTQAFFSKFYVSNSINNLEHIFGSSMINDYFGDFPDDLPFIIVSAGPSLDKNIDLLKEAKGHCFILATDTAVRFLIAHNILPDATVTIDPKKPARPLYDEEVITRILTNENKTEDPEEKITIEQIRDIPLFCSQESNYKVLQAHTGKKIWFKGGGFVGDLFKEWSKTFPPYNVGGSVATAAFAICISFSVKKIILIGQDLAYSGDVTHAGGIVRGTRNEEHGIKMIEGIDGQSVKSRHDWIIYLNWFEESIKELDKAKRGMQVIDATEGGAKIHGTTIMTLREAMDEFCDFSKKIDIKECLENKGPAFDDKQSQEVLQYLVDCRDEMVELQSMARDAATICDKALKLLTSKDKTKSESKKQRKKQHYIDQIMNYNAAIEKKKSYELIDVYIADVASALLRGIFQVSDDQNQDELELLNNAKAIYTAVGKAVDEILPEFDEMLERAKKYVVA